jgi:hypothetical protein
VLHSKVIAYVPSSVIKDILTQLNSDGKRSKWINKLLEYDMEIHIHPAQSRRYKDLWRPSKWALPKTLFCLRMGGGPSLTIDAHFYYCF